LHRFKSRLSPWKSSQADSNRVGFIRLACLEQGDLSPANVTEKGQILIPAALRRKDGIKNGTKIIITDAGDSIILKPVTEQYLKSLQGSLKGKGSLKVLMNERHKDKEKGQ